MLFRLIPIIFLLSGTYKIALSQNELEVRKISSSDFFIEGFETDSLLNQNAIKSNLDDGEYFIYYDSAQTQLWMNGVIIDNKLEGKWEFRNKENEIINYEMFSDGKQIKMYLPENNFVSIYLPNRVFEFKAYYISASNDTLTTSLVTLNTNSQMYEIHHNPRFAGIWTFNYSQTDSIKTGGVYPWNDWIDTTYCSITETENHIQIYPPRRNQFVFTEIIAFPSISPAKLKVGYMWDGQISIPRL